MTLPKSHKGKAIGNKSPDPAEAIMPTPSTVHRELVSNHVLLAFASALAGPSGVPPCSYLSSADVVAREEIKHEIMRQALTFRENGQLTAIRLYHNHEPSWESNGAAGYLRPKQVAKIGGMIKKQSPHSISLISYAAAATDADPGWNFVPYVSTLELVFNEAREDALPPLRPVLRTSGAAYGDRPDFPAETIIKPTEEQVCAVVNSFFSMPENIRAACVALARDANDQKFRHQRSQRTLGIFAAQVLTPLRDAMFASGHGKTMLAVALTVPNARIADGKKNGALSRDRASYMIWTDAHEHKRPKPPFVEA